MSSNAKGKNKQRTQSTEKSREEREGTVSADPLSDSGLIVPQPNLLARSRPPSPFGLEPSKKLTRPVCVLILLLPLCLWQPVMLILIPIPFLASTRKGRPCTSLHGSPHAQAGPIMFIQHTPLAVSLTQHRHNGGSGWRRLITRTQGGMDRQILKPLKSMGRRRTGRRLTEIWHKHYSIRC
jgi:hypothetical protein